jgi:hypothetical protein
MQDADSGRANVRPQLFLGPFSAVRVHTHGRTGAAAVQGDSGSRCREYPGSTVGAIAGFGGAHSRGHAVDATLAYLQQLHGSAPSALARRAAPPVDLPVVAHTPGICGGSRRAEESTASTHTHTGGWADLETILNEMQSAIREVSAASSSAVSGRDSASSVRGGGSTPWKPGGGDDAKSYTHKTHAAQLDALEESLNQVESGLGVSLFRLLRFVCPLRGRDAADRRLVPGEEQGSGPPFLCPREQPYTREGTPGGMGSCALVEGGDHGEGVERASVER